MAEVDLTKQVTESLTSQAAKDSTNMTQTDVPKVAPAVSKAVNADVNAIITNITNQEPLWQSRIFISSTIALVAQAAKMFGVAEIAEADQVAFVDLTLNVITVIGLAYTLFSRAFNVKKPLGQ